MSAPESSFPVERLRAMQIIAAALIVGVLMFGGLAMYMVFAERQGQLPEGQLPVISLLALAMLVVNTPLAFFLPGVVARNGLRQMAATPRAAADAQDDTIRLLTLRQTVMIIGLALLEGAAFLGLVAFLVEGQTFALAVAGVVVILMLIQFPTEARVRSWIDFQAQRLRELREQPNLGP